MSGRATTTSVAIAIEVDWEEQPIVGVYLDAEEAKAALDARKHRGYDWRVEVWTLAGEKVGEWYRQQRGTWEYYHEGSPV